MMRMETVSISIFSYLIERRMMTTRICLVRHGETAWNVERRLQGQLDIDLNAVGLAQADAVGRALADESFVALYSSDLMRTKRTAEAVAGYVGLSVQLDRNFRERHYGKFQGHTYDEAKARHPDEYERFRARDPELTFDSGESLTVFAQRIHGSMEQLARSHRGSAVLVVTHGGVLDIVYRMATSMPIERSRDFGIPNAGLNWVERDERGWRLICWAVEDHLTFSADEMIN